MLGSYVLVIVILNNVYAGTGVAYAHDAPAVSMQEFNNQKACVFAAEVVKRRAGDMAGKLNVVCIAKD